MNLEIKRLADTHIIYDPDENLNYSFETPEELLSWLTKAFEAEALEEFVEAQRAETAQEFQDSIRRRAEEIFNNNKKKKKRKKDA